MNTRVSLHQNSRGTILPAVLVLLSVITLLVVTAYSVVLAETVQLRRSYNTTIALQGADAATERALWAVNTSGCYPLGGACPAASPTTGTATITLPNPNIEVEYLSTIEYEPSAAAPIQVIVTSMARARRSGASLSPLTGTYDCNAEAAQGCLVFKQIQATMLYGAPSPFVAEGGYGGIRMAGGSIIAGADPTSCLGNPDPQTQVTCLLGLPPANVHSNGTIHASQGNNLIIGKVEAVDYLNTLNRTSDRSTAIESGNPCNGSGASAVSICIKGGGGANPVLVTQSFARYLYAEDGGAFTARPSSPCGAPGSGTNPSGERVETAEPAYLTPTDPYACQRKSSLSPQAFSITDQTIENNISSGPSCGGVGMGSPRQAGETCARYNEAASLLEDLMCTVTAPPNNTCVVPVEYGGALCEMRKPTMQAELDFIGGTCYVPPSWTARDIQISSGATVALRGSVYIAKTPNTSADVFKISGGSTLRVASTDPVIEKGPPLGRDAFVIAEWPMSFGGNSTVNGRSDQFLVNLSRFWGGKQSISPPSAARTAAPPDQYDDAAWNQTAISVTGGIGTPTSTSLSAKFFARHAKIDFSGNATVNALMGQFLNLTGGAKVVLTLPPAPAVGPYWFPISWTVQKP